MGRGNDVSLVGAFGAPGTVSELAQAQASRMGGLDSAQADSVASQAVPEMMQPDQATADKYLADFEATGFIPEGGFQSVYDQSLLSPVMLNYGGEQKAFYAPDSFGIPDLSYSEAERRQDAAIAANPTRRTTGRRTESVYSPQEVAAAQARLDRFQNIYDNSYRPYRLSAGYSGGGLIRRFAQGGALEKGLGEMAAPGMPGMMPPAAPGSMANDQIDQMLASAPGASSLDVPGMLNESQQAQMITEIVDAASGKYPPEYAQQVLQAAVEMLGEEVVMEIIQMAQQTQDGTGDGMSDSALGMLGNEPIALSEGEVIVPADVVAAAGNGSNEAGARVYEDIGNAFRMARTGTTEQPEAIDSRGIAGAMMERIA